jgi:hypothetical protein
MRSTVGRAARCSGMRIRNFLPVLVLGWLAACGYHAILGMEVTGSQSGVIAFAVNLTQDLKPLIRAAL